MTEDTKAKYRILAVDDDQTILDLYQQILSSDAKRGGSNASFEVDCCTQGEEAVETVKLSLAFNRSYSVIFLVRMENGRQNRFKSWIPMPILYWSAALCAPVRKK
jgi:CheY-like chemotaxis protein